MPNLAPETVAQAARRIVRRQRSHLGCARLAALALPRPGAYVAAEPEVAAAPPAEAKVSHTRTHCECDAHVLWSLRESSDPRLL
jgi:hypothetical protein